MILIKKKDSKASLIPLPRDIAQFDALVNEIVLKYSLPNWDHAAAVISNAIRHLPNDEAFTTLDYLGHSVIKNIANQTAYHKSETIKHETQVQVLFDALTSDPKNTQARDQLEKAANEGSTSAKAALEKLQLPASGSVSQVISSNVTPIKGA